MEDSQDKRKLVLPVINLNKLAPGFKLSQTTSFHSNPPVPNAPGSGTISVGSSLNVGYGKALESTQLRTQGDLSATSGRHSSEGPGRSLEESKGSVPNTVTPNKLRRNYVEVETIYRTQQQPTSNPRPPSAKMSGSRSKKRSRKPAAKKTPIYQQVSLRRPLVQSPRRSTSRTPERASGAALHSPKSSKGSLGASGSQQIQEYVSMVEPIGKSANEQLATLALEFSRNDSIPIPLERLDQKYMFQRHRNPGEDNSGTVMYSKQGFLEVPKEKGKPSEFISQKQYAQEAIYYEMFSKLGFYKNFYPRKALAGWRRVTRSAHFHRNLGALSKTFWFAKPLFAKNVPTLHKTMHDIEDLTGHDIREQATYGKRHTDFPSRQRVLRTAAIAKFESITEVLLEMLEVQHREVTRYTEKHDQDVLDKQIKEIVDQRRSDFIGIDRPPRGVAKQAAELESVQNQILYLHEGFVLLTKTMYQETIIKMLIANLSHLVFVLCGNRKPRFEVLMIVKESVKVDPELKMFKTMIFDSIDTYTANLLASPIITKLNNLALVLRRREPSTGYSMLTVYIQGFLPKYEPVLKLRQQMAEQLQKDVSGAEEFKIQFAHLTDIKTNGLEWIQGIKDKTIDIIQFYKENYKRVNSYNEKIFEIPEYNTNIGIISIETSTIRTELLEIPKVVSGCLKDHVLDVLLNDSAELKQELFTHFQALEERATNLSSYVAQLKSIYNLRKAKVVEFQKRLEFIYECLNICRRDGIRVSANAVITIEEIKSLIDSVDGRIKLSEEYYAENKGYFDEQMLNATKKLTRKIRKFASKYKQRYLEETDRFFKPDDTLRELEKRNEALALIKKRVETYEEYDHAIFEIEHGGEDSYEMSVGQAECKKCFDDVYNLHCDCIKLWKLMGYWHKCKGKWYETKFSELNIRKIRKRCERMQENTKTSAFQDPNFPGAAGAILKQFADQIAEIEELLDVLTDLKNPNLKPRHWDAIVKIIRKPHFLAIAFSLSDLIDAKINRYSLKIKAVIEDALAESKHEDILVKIKEEWEEMELETMPYRNRLDTFILVSTKKVEYLVEEHRAVIESLEFSQHAEHIRGEIEDWKTKLDLMSDNLDLWVQCQKSWLYLEPIFSNLKGNLPNEFDVFQEISQNFRKIMWSAHQNPKATYNLLQQNRIQLFEEILQAITVVRRNIHEFLESRRLSFPRFFFLCDNQLLELIAAANSQAVYDRHITAIFPAVSKLYIKRIASGKSTIGSDDEDIDMDAAPFNIFSPAGNELMDPFEFSESEANLNEQMSCVQQGDEEVLGESEEIVGDRDYNIVEKQRRLKEKYSNLPANLNPAHPYEILGMLGHNQELLLFEKSVGLGESPEHWMAEVEGAMKETLGKMIAYSVQAFPKLSLDEWILDFPQQIIFSSIYLILTHEIEELLDEMDQEHEASGTGPSYSFEASNEPVPDQYEDHFSRVFFGSGAQTASLDQSRVRLMRILQAKSFKGLFLRLQFWVNQIVKSVTADTHGRLPPIHKTSLESIVNLLIYQRDIVGDLLAKKVSSAEDFEWLKNMRLSWNTKDNYAKIECGALSLIQGNEYLGTTARLLCNPVTTRCFMFISSALREHSSVLFKVNRAHDFASDIFDEFSSICGICCKKFFIQENTEISSLMQFLNGAALANMWSIFEHVDRLSAAQLQVISKEIQMVQQQFLIAEMGDEDDEGSIEDDDQEESMGHSARDPSTISRNSDLPPQRRLDDSSVVSSGAQLVEADSIRQPPSQRESQPHSRRQETTVYSGTRVERSGVDTYSSVSEYVTDSNWKMGKAKVASKLNMNLFVVFASLSSTSNQFKDMELLKTLQSSFRCMELLKPNFTLLLHCLLIKQEFQAFKPLAKAVLAFLAGVQEKYPEFFFTSRDMHTIVYLAKSWRRAWGSEEERELHERWAIAKAIKMYCNHRLTTILGEGLSRGEATNLMDGLIASCFALQSPHYPNNKELQEELENNMVLLKLNFSDAQVRAAVQLWELLRLNRGVVILGPPASGKSTLIRILANALNKLGSIAVQKFTINPNIFTSSELFGDHENEQVTGMLHQLLAQETKPNAFRWLVLNCEAVQPRWADVFIPMLDATPIMQNQTKSLKVDAFFAGRESQLESKENFVTLPNSMHFHLPQDISLVFETESIGAASPSWLTRVGAVYVGAEDLGWESIFTHFARNVSERFVNIGISGTFHLERLLTRFKDIITKTDRAVASSNPNWNVRTLAISFCRIVLNITEVFIAPEYEDLDELQQELAGVDEAALMALVGSREKERLGEVNDLFDVAGLVALVWSFGAVLSPDERPKFSMLVHKDRHLDNPRHMYPLDSNVFEYYFDWQVHTFKPFMKSNVTLYSNMPVVLNEGANFVAPDVVHFQIRYLMGVLIAPSKRGEREVKHELQQVCLAGPAGSGKTSIAHWALNTDGVTQITCSITKFNGIRKLQELVEPHYIVKNLDEASPANAGKQVVLLVEDLHMDQTGVPEFLEYWQTHGGFYTSAELAFRTLRAINFVTTCNGPAKPRAKTNIFFIAPIDGALFKQILNSYVYSRQFTTVLLMHRYIGIMSSVLSRLRKSEGLATSRVVDCLRTMIFFTQDADLHFEQDGEEQIISEMFGYELSCQFSRSLWETARAVICPKFNSQLDTLYLFGDYSAETRIKYNIPVPYNKICPVPGEDSTTQQIDHRCKAYRCRECFYDQVFGPTNNEANQITSIALHRGKLHQLWAVARAIQAPNKHLVITAQAGFELVQMACILKRTELYEPRMAKRSAFDEFRQWFEAGLIEVLDRVNNDANWETKPPPRVVLVRTSHQQEPLIYDYLVQFVSGDVLTLLSTDTRETLAAEELNARRTSTSQPKTDPLQAALAKVLSWVTVVILAENDLTTLNRFPDLPSAIDFIKDKESVVLNDVQQMLSAILGYRKFPNHEDLVPVLNEVYFFLREATKRYSATVDQLDTGTKIDLDQFLTLSRLIQFVEFFMSLYTKLSGNILEKQEKVKDLIDKAGKLQAFHGQISENKTALQSFSSETQANIDDYLHQIDRMRKAQAEKAVIIKQKEEENAHLKGEFDILERDNQMAMSGRDKRVAETIEQFDSGVSKEDFAMVLANRAFHTDDSFRVLESLALVISGNEGLMNRLSDIIKEISLKDSCLRRMRMKADVMMPPLIAGKVAETVTCVEVKKLHPVLATVFYWLEAMLNRLKAIKVLGPNFLRVEEIRQQIDSNNQQITLAHQAVIDLENELKTLTSSKEKMSDVLNSRQSEIQQTEMAHNRTDQLLKAIVQMNSKLTTKREALDARIEMLVGDCILLAASVVFLGVFPCTERMRLRNAISRIVEAGNLGISEEWGMANEFSHLKQFRRVLKESGFERLDYHINFVMQDLTLYEAAFAFLFSPSCVVLVDELGELKKFFRDTCAEHRSLSLSAADPVGETILESAIRGKIPVFLEDVQDPHPDTDLEGWKIGPGATLDRFYLQTLSQFAFSIYNPGAPCYGNRRYEYLGRFYGYQTTLVASRSALCLNTDYTSHATFIYGADMNKSEAWIEVKMVLLKHLIPKAYELMLEQRASLLQAKQDLTRLRSKYESDLINCEEATLRDYDAFSDIIGQQGKVEAAERVYNTRAAEYHKSINEHPLIASYSHVMVLMFYALKQLGRLTGDVTYSWDCYLTLTDMVVAKILRDVKNNMQDDSTEQQHRAGDMSPDEIANEKFSIDEDFFHRVVIPSMWVVLVTGIPQEHVALYTLILSMHIAIKKKEISAEEYAIFSARFLGLPNALTWASSFDNYTSPDADWSETLQSMITEISSLYGDATPVLTKIAHKLGESNNEAQYVPMVIRHVLERSKGRLLPLFQRIMIASFYPDKLFKRLLRQFVYEQLNTVFEFSEEPIKLHSFIKTASWNLPIALFSTPGLNIVNTICSLANYYGVGLEVIRTDPGYDKKDEGEDSVDLIEKCAYDGSWVLISTSKFISFHKKLLGKLDEIRSQGGFCNTFRLFIDLQGLRHYEMPDSFLHYRSVRFYMSETNAEDIEGYNDVWGNLLNEDILKMDNMFAEDSSILTRGDITENTEAAASNDN